MAGIAQRLKAVLVVSLRSQCRPRWVLTHVPLRLYPDEKSSLQRTATQRHRTQLYEILGSFELFFRKVTCFAKTSQFQPNNSIYQSFFRVNNEFKFSTFFGVNLECLAAQGVPRFFAKHVTLRKFLCHFLDRKKDAERRPFLRYSLEKAYPLHGSALVVHRRVDV